MVRVATQIASIVQLGMLRFDGLTVTGANRDDNRALTSGERSVMTTEVPGLASRVTMVRAMYRRMGIDPTKTRPSSEALLRRVRKGQPLPRINSLVDVCNRCSLEVQLLYGLYDADAIVGAIEFRYGQTGDEYAGIRKSVVHLADRPALVVVYAPLALPADQLGDVLARTAVRVSHVAGGVEQGRWVLGKDKAH